MKNILLNWLPPSLENSPSPSLSVLKSFLERQGYCVHILYWNLRMNSLLKEFLNFGNLIYEGEIYKFLPFFSYYAIKINDIDLQQKIKYFILNLKPQLHNKGMAFLQDYLLDYSLKIDKFIDEELDRVNLEDFLYVGFSTQFYQWIVGNIIAEKIREKSPNMTIIAGGFGTREEASAFLSNFGYYNYTMWGEGEYSLLSLTRYLDNKEKTINEISSIPNVVYRINNQYNSNIIRNKFVNIEDCEYDYSEFYKEIQHTNIALDLSIPIEGGRGCHWKRCNFCFLNSGYKYRTKSPKKNNRRN